MKNNRKNLGNIQNMDRDNKSIENSYPLYQTYTHTRHFKNINQNVDHHTGKNRFIHVLHTARRI